MEQIKIALRVFATAFAILSAIDAVGDGKEKIRNKIVTVGFILVFWAIWW